MLCPWDSGPRLRVEVEDQTCVFGVVVVAGTCYVISLERFKPQIAGKCVGREGWISYWTQTDPNFWLGLGGMPVSYWKSWRGRRDSNSRPLPWQSG